MVEYEACIAGLEAALDMNIKDWEVYGDSILIISQSIGEWGVKSPELAKYNGYLTKVRNAFRSVSFYYLLHSKNQFADALATLSSMFKISEEMNCVYYGGNSRSPCILP